MRSRLAVLILLLLPAIAWSETVAPAANADPWEDINRKVFAFDMQFDRWLLKPAAIGYQKVTPNFGQKMVRNFFSNLKDISSGVNAVFQWRPGQAGSNFSRVLLNTTLGLGGLFDVASDADLVSYRQDFGLTLARWGLDSGPYLVLPFLGPSTVRDTAGLLPDIYVWPPHYVRNEWVSWGEDALYAVSRRAELLELEKTIVGDRYLWVRDYYLQSRALAAGKAVADDFGSPADTQGQSDKPEDDW